MIASAKPSVDEQSIRYQALTKLTELADGVATVRNLNNSNDKILQVTKIRLWLKALDYKNYLSREQREKIWYALIQISGIYDFPVAPVLANVSRPDILIGGGGGGAGSVNEWGDIGGTLSNQLDLQAALDAKVDISGDTMTGDLGFTGAGINPTDYIQFNTTPTAYTPAIGNIGWNDVEGTIDLLLRGGVVNLPLGQKQVARVVNGTGGNVLKSNYQAVKVIGAQGQRLQVALAQANNDANSADTLGLIAENINNNNTGFIVTSGMVENINTTGSLQGETWVDGNPLYLSPTVAGRITNIKPQAPQHTVIVGFVVYSHANNGKIYVKVDNGYELDELHNVRITTGTLSNGQVLKYNSTLSVWENQTVPDGHTIQDAGVAETQRTNLNFQRMLVTDDAGNNATVVTRPADTYVGITAPASPVEGDVWTNSETWSTYKYYDGFWVEVSNINPAAVTGTGTSGYVTYWTGTNSVSGSSSFTWNNSTRYLTLSGSDINQVINQTNTASASALIFQEGGVTKGYLQYVGSTFATTTRQQLLEISGTNGIAFRIGGGGEISRFTVGGNFLINTTTDAGFKLDVNGLSSFTGTTASDGGQLGSELLSTSGWTSTGWTGSFGAGWTHTVGNTTALTNTLAAVIGNYYQITWTVTGRTAGTFTITFGGYSSGGQSATGNAGPRATSTATLSITPTTDFDGTIIISIKVITQGSATVTIKNSAGTVINEINGSTSNTNTFFGLDAGARTTTGTRNTFGGYISGQNNTSGINNTGYGSLALENITTGFNNSAFGVQAINQATSAINNSAFGRDALYSTTTSSSNSAFGQNALYSITTTNNNSAFGYEAGRYAGAGTTANQTSVNSLYLGYQTRSSASGNTNEVVIGYNVVGLGSNTTILGNSSTVTTGIYGNLLLGSTTDSGEKLQVTGTAKITGASSFGGNMTLSFNQNNFTTIEVNNTNAGASAHSTFRANNSTGKFECGKLSSTFGGYKINASNDSIIYNLSSGDIAVLNDFSGGKIKFSAGSSSTAQWQIETNGQLTAGDAINIAFGTTTGTKIGTSTSQKIGFFNATPIVQPSAVTTSQGIADALSSLGLLASSSISSSGGIELGAGFDGMGSVVTVNSICYVRVKSAFTITAWSIIAEGTSPTCTVDILKIASGTTLPTSSITASAAPALSTGNAVKSTTMTGWTTSLTADDILAFKVTAATNATKIVIQLYN